LHYFLFIINIDSLLGIYGDADTYCNTSISDWFDTSYWSNPATSLVVGIEINEPNSSQATRIKWRWSRVYGFAQYTMASKPFADPLRTAIVRVVAHAYALAKSKGVKDPQSLWGYTDVDTLEVTGPGMWTDSIIDALETARQDDAKLSGVPVDKEKRITWEPFSKLDKPTLFETGGVLVLPINYFGSGQRHSGAGNFKTDESRVLHYFSKTWKKGWWDRLFGRGG
jgi:hypothetical protein